MYIGSYLFDSLWHREVEDFARRLNSDWPERIQEFLSPGQERKTMLFATNGNGFLRRNICMFFLFVCSYFNICDSHASWIFKFSIMVVFYPFHFSSLQHISTINILSIPFLFKFALSVFYFFYFYAYILTLAFTASIYH